MEPARRVTIDERTTTKYDQAGLSGQFNQGRFKDRDTTKNVQFDTEAEAANDPTYQTREQPRRAVVRGSQSATRTRDTATLQEKKKVKTTASDRAKASVVNTSIMVWLVPSYTSVQIPLAMLNIVFFGLMAFTYELFEGDAGIDDEGNFITGFFSRAGKLIARTLNKAIEILTGFDFGEFLVSFPAQAFLVTFSLLLFYACAVFAGAAATYKAANIKPLSGKKSGLKLSALVMAIVGYSTPFLNLFPWAIFWTLVVWRYPK